MKSIHSKFVVFSGALAIALLAGCNREEKVVAPPVAAVAEKCADVDMDGICDTADQCPASKPGTRVGPAGCDCDYMLRTHFASESAELSDEDKAELDRLATVMMNPQLHFVAGEIDGYTDDTGDATANVDLSKKRAEAVAAYLQSKGVVLGERFVAKGYGKENPIADNTTEEGRAENRRAIIRRSDCGPAS